jgi:exodeoxyribonuclease VII large subunit
LIASPSSAAISDFTNVLGRRRVDKYLPLTYQNQGVGAEYELIEALKQANTFIDDQSIDTVVITRGGGSKDDLQVFNVESVVRAVFGLNKPTIVAIGHERDVSLAELAADCRASTPSQAAELVSLSTEEVISNLPKHWSQSGSLFSKP